VKSSDQILTEMNNVQAQFPALSELTSTSDSSLIVSLKKMWVLLTQVFSSEWDTFQASIEEKIANTAVGSMLWYVTQTKNFQYGDTISILNGRVSYDVIDDQKKIVTQAAIVEDSATGRLAIKAAKNGDGGKVPLSSDELEALKDYVNLVKYAGVVADVTSLDADDVKLVATCKVDRQLIATTGALLSDSTKFPIKDAIKAFLAALPYNSVLNNTELTDYVQSVKGVKDFTITGSFMRRPASVTWVSYTREVVSLAGHARLHADSTITYIN
jgi:hypothetical protein